VTDDRDERCTDILSGLATYFDSPFVADIAATASRHRAPDLGHALNPNQMASKRWLADALAAAAGGRFGTITVLGGWFGVLPAILLDDRRLAIARVVSVDIDPRCAEIARSLNATHVRTGRFAAVTADMHGIAYAPPVARSPDPDLVVNTSCEHLADFGGWFARVPAGQLVALQSNDYYAIDEHVNCVPDLAAFRAQAPLAELLYSGEQPRKRYRRFMLIGRK
jgi:hypothetical protein